VRRLFRWAIGLLSALAIWRAWSRRRRSQEVANAPEPDPADELRRKLAETRTDEAPAEDAVEAPAESLEERRARIHAKAQETLDAMHEVDT
jgi:hypothetical protein